MGMVIYLRRASPSELQKARAQPDIVQDFAFQTEDPNLIVDFDKAWHALHHLFTGSGDATDSPLSILIDKTAEIGADEHGFGGFWIIEPARMKAFSDALSSLDDAALAAKYDPAAMDREQVYLSDVFVEEGDEALDYVMQGVPALRKFAQNCVQNGDGAIKILA